jgi:hypothetical protein
LNYLSLSLKVLAITGVIDYKKLYSLLQPNLKELTIGNFGSSVSTSPIPAPLIHFTTFSDCFYNHLVNCGSIVAKKPKNMC